MSKKNQKTIKIKFSELLNVNEITWVKYIVVLGTRYINLEYKKIGSGGRK
jgi:hypothetical protein